MDNHVSELDSRIVKCSTHPGVETNLRCAKCGKPICPKCMVQTPVGARCRDCAGLYKLPTYSVSAKYYLRAAGVGLGAALVTGLIWGTIEASLPFITSLLLIILNFLLAAGVGYVIGESVSLSVNRKRGTGLAVVAGLAVVISYLVSIVVPWGVGFLLLDLLALAVGIFLAVTRLR